MLSQETREWAIHSNVNQELIALSRLAIGTQSPAFCRHGWHTQVDKSFTHLEKT